MPSPSARSSSIDVGAPPRPVGAHGSAPSLAPDDLKTRLTSAARHAGFLELRVVRALPEEEARSAALLRVLDGWFSGLPWFTPERVTRMTDPEAVLPGARSVVLLLASYAHRAQRPDDGRLRGRVARYAWGRDYHRVLEKRARPLLALLDELAPGSENRFLVDYGPLMERAYAAKAGLGWQGKNTMLLSRGVGAYTFLAAILTTADLEPDEPVATTCGACSRCLPACPTGALRGPYELVNDLCISYQTIENRGPIPRELRPLMGDWVFGCDLCIEVCPVTDKWQPDGLPEFAPGSPEDAFPDLVALLALTEDEFKERFAGRPIMRAKWAGLLRNACVALGNRGDREAIPALRDALRHESPLVRGHAAWALGRLGARDLLLAAAAEETDPDVSEEIEAALSSA
jgi:epoxyqueuosine reductase